MVTSEGGLRTILVPLDGSELAEEALPVARQLAGAMGSQLLLARVTPLMPWAVGFPSTAGYTSPEVYQRLLDEEDQATKDYLEHLAREAGAAGITTRTISERGDATSTLLDVLARERPDLVVMTTHGRSGLRRFALGSIADRLVRSGAAPVLLLRSFEEKTDVRRLERALVPLDGSPLAEEALAMAVRLAGPVVRHIKLVRAVIPQLISETPEAQAYLDGVRQRLTEQLAGRSCVVEQRVVAGQAAEMIVAESEQDCDFILMATHGLGGARRWAFGSIMDRVLHAARVPLLVVRPE
jgi:nucleotide-binding universal stress UspA family protein